MIARKIRRTHSKWAIAVVAAAVTVMFAASPAQAIPMLQLYIEGSVYDSETESWVLEPAPGEPAPTSITLWAIGAVGKGNPIEPIVDVRLAIAYSSEFGELDFVFSPGNTGGQGGFWPGAPGDEPLTQPGNPARLQFVIDDPGTTPTLSDGKNLPSHGVYNQAGVAWQEFALNDFDLNAWHLTDFIDDDFEDLTPESSHPGQIKVWEISVFGDAGAATSFHFDLYNSKPAGMSGKAKAWFAPFSHDAHADVTHLPTPAAAGIGVVGALMLLSLRGNRRRDDAAAV